MLQLWYIEILSTWDTFGEHSRGYRCSRQTLTPLSGSPNFPSAQYLDIRALTHELIC